MKIGMRGFLRLACQCAIPCLLCGCAVVSAVDTAASVTGTVVSTTADVAGSVVKGAADTVSGSNDKDKEKPEEKSGDQKSD